LSVSPDPSSTPPTINATIDDKFFGLSKIQAAEYFIDNLGTPGTGTKMTLGLKSDGGVIRQVSAVIPSSVWAALSPGTHTIYVEGQDVMGNWGFAASITFTKIQSSASVASWILPTWFTNGNDSPGTGFLHVIDLLRNQDRLAASQWQMILSHHRVLNTWVSQFSDVSQADVEAAFEAWIKALSSSEAS
jgi:hypothetical protein